MDDNAIQIQNIDNTIEGMHKVLLELYGVSKDFVPNFLDLDKPQINGFVRRFGKFLSSIHAQAPKNITNRIDFVIQTSLRLWQTYKEVFDLPEITALGKWERYLEAVCLFQVLNFNILKADIGEYELLRIMGVKERQLAGNDVTDIWASPTIVINLPGYIPKLPNGEVDLKALSEQESVDNQILMTYMGMQTVSAITGSVLSKFEDESTRFQLIYTDRTEITELAQVAAKFLTTELLEAYFEYVSKADLNEKVKRDSLIQIGQDLCFKLNQFLKEKKNILNTQEILAALWQQLVAKFRTQELFELLDKSAHEELITEIFNFATENFAVGYILPSTTFSLNFRDTNDVEKNADYGISGIAVFKDPLSKIDLEDLFAIRLTLNSRNAINQIATRGVENTKNVIEIFNTLVDKPAILKYLDKRDGFEQEENIYF